MAEHKLLTISEMAYIHGITRTTLIYYDKIGLFQPETVDENGYRYYSPTQIPMLREICFLRSIGMPTTVGQLGITLDEQAIEKLAWMCTFEGRRTIGSFKVLGLEEIKDIYRAAR